MDDLDRVVELWLDLAAEQREHGSHISVEPNREPIRMAIAGRIVDDGVLLAREDGDVIGFLMFEIEAGTYESEVTRGFVENVYVEPGSRNRGVGSELFGAAEAAMAEAGADAVALSVMAENEDARRFYDRLGYRPHRIEYERSLADADGE